MYLFVQSFGKYKYVYVYVNSTANICLYVSFNGHIFVGSYMSVHSKYVIHTTNLLEERLVLNALGCNL